MLALIGSGEYLAAIEALDRQLLARLNRPAHVVCLPTAAGREGDAVIDDWMQRGVHHFTKLGATARGVRVIDRLTAADAASAAQIRQANFVYLSGGNPLYLYNTLVDTPVWQAIMAVHEGGGLVAGCSAGAMVMGERIVGPQGRSDGFGLLPNTVIVPHFDEIPGVMVQLVRRLSSTALLIGVDGRTALLVDGGAAQVLGAGEVTFWDKSGSRRYADGAQPPMAAR